jgi:hypothetical protein
MISVAVLLLSFSFSAFGQEAFTVTVGSTHYATDETKDETNPGFIVTNDLSSRLDVKWGAFKNSEGKSSAFLAVGPDFKIGNYVRGSAVAAAASGYGTLITPLQTGTVIYFPAANISVGPKNYGITFIALPGAVGFGATIRF